MNIVHSALYFYPFKGGLEEVIFYLSKEMVSRGHRVKVICADEPKVGDLTVENIQVRRLPFIGKISNTNIVPLLAQELYKENFDVLHTHFPFPWTADISAFISIIKRKPLFLTFHNDIIGKGIYRAIASGYRHTLLKLLLGRAHKIFIYHKDYPRFCPILKKYINKIVVAPPGVDTNKFRPLNSRKNNSVFNIFFLCRLDRYHRYKGLEYLLEGVKNISGKVPVKLRIGGSGDLLNYYKNFVSQNKLEDIVEFLGFIDDANLNAYYNWCDVFVLPTISAIQEGFGLVALEAMACAKPVIVSELVGAAEDIKKSKAGIVVAPKDTQDLTEALLFLASHEDERKTMGENAYLLAKAKYSWGTYTDIIEEEYKIAQKY